MGRVQRRVPFSLQRGGRVLTILGYYIPWETLASIAAVSVFGGVLVFLIVWGAAE